MSTLANPNASVTVSQVKVDEVRTVDLVLTFCMPRVELEPLICYHYPMIEEKIIRQKANEDGVTHFATGIAVFQDGRLLVVRRVAHDDFLAGEWELPGGGVDAGETIEQGAVRELKEETNLDVEKIIGTFEGFDYSTPKKPKVRQINFKVSVKPGDIILTEHDMFRWITVSEVIELKTNDVMHNCLVNAFK